jgi:MSHA biogenesis protein MshM
VLTGQPGCADTSPPHLRQLRQRIAIEHHVEFLKADQVPTYLAYRIEVAGGRYEEIFAPGSEPTFYAFSSGCPRLVSLLADRVLLSAFGKQIRPVPPDLVESKAKEMEAARSEGVAEAGDLLLELEE